MPMQRFLSLSLSHRIKPTVLTYPDVNKEIGIDLASQRQSVVVLVYPTTLSRTIIVLLKYVAL